MASLEYLAKAFNHFSEMTGGASFLYSTTSREIAADPEILELASGGQKGQPPVNLFYGAIQYLLLNRTDHPLAAYYPAISGAAAPAEDPYPVLRDFCLKHSEAIRELVASRRVQTNEVRRCGCLLPAFAVAFELGGGLPLHLIEIGPSAGLNLLFDRYHYRYSDGRSCGAVSPVQIVTELRGDDLPPIPATMPAVAERIGVDIAPVDVCRDDEVAWLQALIWPEQVDRIELQRAAINLARQDPPRLLAGDGRELLPKLLEEVNSASRACVFHSHATCQMSREVRTEFDKLLDSLGAERDMIHISQEWLNDDEGPRLELTTWFGGEKTLRYLADCHHHGRWLCWKDRQTAV